MLSIYGAQKINKNAKCQNRGREFSSKVMKLPNLSKFYFSFANDSWVLTIGLPLWNLILSSNYIFTTLKLMFAKGNPLISE